MTATNHVIMGALVATYIHNPWVAIPVAFASHFVLDSLPHFDAPVKPGVFDLRFLIWLAVDCGLAASILLTIFALQPTMLWLILASAVAAASPDFMWLYYQVIEKSSYKPTWPWLVRLHWRVQKFTGPKWWPVELLWALASGGLLVSRLH